MRGTSPRAGRSNARSPAVIRPPRALPRCACPFRSPARAQGLRRGRRSGGQGASARPNAAGSAPSTSRICRARARRQRRLDLGVGMVGERLEEFTGRWVHALMYAMKGLLSTVRVLCRTWCRQHVIWEGQRVERSRCARETIAPADGSRGRRLQNAARSALGPLRCGRLQPCDSSGSVSVVETARKSPGVISRPRPALAPGAIERRFVVQRAARGVRRAQVTLGVRWFEMSFLSR